MTTDQEAHDTYWAAYNVKRSRRPHMTILADEALKKAGAAFSDLHYRELVKARCSPRDMSCLDAECMAAAIRALTDAGYEVLPREPTREMWAASGNAVVNGKLGRVHHDKVSQAVWAAMLAAAPKLMEVKT